MNKFRNKKIFTKDGKFDSKREMHRYLELAAMQQAGKITGLERQARYILIGSQKREDGTTDRTPRIIYSRFPLHRQRGKDCC